MASKTAQKIEKAFSDLQRTYYTFEKYLYGENEKELCSTRGNRTFLKILRKRWDCRNVALISKLFLIRQENLLVAPKRGVSKKLRKRKRALRKKNYRIADEKNSFIS